MEQLTADSNMVAAIEDPEAVWKTTNPIWLEEEAKKDAAKKKKEGHEMHPESTSSSKPRSTERMQFNNSLNPFPWSMEPI